MISILEELFAGGSETFCSTLCDVNGDGELSISDPVALLDFLFLGVRLRIPLPPPEELCDRADNDCNGEVDEVCPDGPAAVVELEWDAVTRDIKGNPEETVGYLLHIGRQPEPPWPRVRAPCRDPRAGLGARPGRALLLHRDGLRPRRQLEPADGGRFSGRQPVEERGGNPRTLRKRPGASTATPALCYRTAGVSLSAMVAGGRA